MLKHILAHHKVKFASPERLVLNVFAAIPGLLRLFMSVPRCQSTIVLTNLGRPFADSALSGEDGFVRVGRGERAMTLIGVDTMPPVRYLTRLSVSVNGYGGKLSLTGRYDSTVMTSDDATWFLTEYGRRLQSPSTSNSAMTGQ
jgi:hypothetical protein